MRDGDSLLRGLPQVQRLLEAPAAHALCARFGRNAVTNALRETLSGFRADISSGRRAEAPDADAVLARSAEALARRRPGLRRVINATGVILHTNLGRAPLASEAIAAVAAVAGGYSNLELDLPSGQRGARAAAIEPLLRELTGAEAALAVNNGAAAILLALSALAKGGEVIVSRGELVEIGGGFRIPEVIAGSGARLAEVGATNKTRLADYEAAIGADTRVLLKVHQSNFRMIGFTEATGVAALSGLAGARGLMTVVDLGSGLLRETQASAEPTIADTLAAGADLVTCSGDKLLGGPQAGLIMGKAAAVDRLRRHALLRALRLDKMSLAALEATLMLHRDAPQRIPALRMMQQSESELHQRAERLRALIGVGGVERTEGLAGGGALPEERVASYALVFARVDAQACAARLRAGDPPVIGRLRDGRLLLDMLTIGEDELGALAAAMRLALS